MFAVYLISILDRSWADHVGSMVEKESCTVSSLSMTWAKYKSLILVILQKTEGKMDLGKRLQNQNQNLNFT